MKKLLTFLLVLTASVGVINAQSGTCGDNLTWTLSNDTLTISGTGAMADYSSNTDVPWYGHRSAIKTVLITEGVTSIGDRAFRGCSSLTSITIPNSVTSIGYEAFRDCSSLTSINVDSNNPNYSSVDGVLFNKEKTTLVAYPGGKQGAYTIPNSVTSIGNYAFRGCSSLTSVTIGNSVTSIGEYAFYGCKSLTSVTIPNSVTSIGESAFYGCSSLTSVTIPNGVTSIGSGAFSGCSSLKSMIVESGNTVYDSRENCNAFIETATNTLIAGCQNTIIPNSVTSIGNGAFRYCSSLTSVTIPNGVTSIGSGAFSGCSSVTSVTIPNSVTSIGESAFYGCFSLTSVTIPNSVTSIEDYAFSYCSSLKSMIVESGNTVYDSRENCNAFIETATNTLIAGCQNTIIPNSVTSIGSRAFFGCYSLTSVTIPNSVTTIGEATFEHCTGLTSIAFEALNPPSFTTFSFYDTNNCPIYVPCGTKDAYVAVLNVNNTIDESRVIEKLPYTYSILTPDSTLGSVTITQEPTTCTEPVIFRADAAEGYRFTQWSDGNTDNPRSLILTQDTTITAEFELAQCLFASGTCGAQGDNLTWELSCDSVLTISGTGAMADYASASNVPWYDYSKAIKSVIITDGVTSIGRHAFYSCSSLTSIIIPDSVTSIGDDAFGWCSSLTSVTIGDGVTSIGEWAFYSCSSLTSVTIGNSVTSIGYQAFENCTSLTSINVVNDNPNYCSVDGVLFNKDITKLIQYPIGNIRSEYTIPNSVTSIGDHAFSGCESLTSVTIPNSVTSIGKNAFRSCSSLASIDIDTSNPNYCSLDGVLLNKDKTTLIQYPIGNTRSEYTIPNSVTSIGNYAFSGCSSLTSISAGSRVTSIGDCAFRSCSSLISITFEAITPPTIGDLHVFHNTNNCPIYVPCGTKDAYVTALNENNTIDESRVIEKTFIASGTCGAQGDNLTWELSCDSILTISGTGEMVDWNYGEQNYAPWRDYSNFVVTVILPDGLTHIGHSAFFGCSQLQNINIPNTVTSVGEYALTKSSNPLLPIINGIRYADTYLVAPINNNLSSYIIEEGTKWIGTHAFYTVAISSITIPNSVIGIGSRSFIYTDLTEITIPNSVETIGNAAFYDCNHLKDVIIGSGVKWIGYSAFSDCNSLSSITCKAVIPPVLEEARVFRYTSKTIPLYVPAESIDAYKAAEEWKEFINILPIEEYPAPCLIASGYCGADSTNLTWELSCDSVLTISGTGAMADYYRGWTNYNKTIKSIIITEGITSIGDWAFSGCSSLTTVTIPNSVTSIGMQAFLYCDSLNAVYITDIAAWCGIDFYDSKSNPLYSAHNLYINGELATDLIIPNSVTTVTQYVFESCYSLTSVTIPNSVTSIGKCAFRDCNSLNAVYITDLTAWCGIYFQDSKASPLFYAHNLYLNGKLIEDLVIPNNTTNIGRQTFCYCTSLTSVTIPNSVTTIGRSAFNRCSSLTSVTFEGLGLLSIDSLVFDNTNNCPIYIPCGTKDAYVAALNVNNTIDESRVIEKLPYPYSILTSDSTLGFVTITQEPTCTEPVIFRADAAEGYQFTQWSDGNTDNPRSLILTQDTTITALFEQIVIEQDTIIVADSTGISDIIPDGQDTIPYVEVQPDGEITIDITDVRIGVITIVTIGTESGQVHPGFGGNYDELENTRVVMEYVLNPFGQTASPDKWYAFAVPFEVDIENGITRKYGNKSHTPGVDFIILEYDSELRSRTGSGWVEKKLGSLTPGHIYMLGIEGNCNRWLFEKKRGAAIVGDKEKDLQHYAQGNSKNNGWHGLGNTTLEYVDMSFDGLNATYVYTYDNQYGRYNIYSIEELILAVGQPFFTQGDNDGSVAFTPNNGKGKGNGKKNMPIYAPSYDVQPSHPRVLLTIETEKINATPDRLYITLHDDNQCGSYRIGRDFMRMDKGSKQVPNFWCPMADGTQLSAHGVSMPTTYTTIPLGIFTPAKGEYTINAHMQDMNDYIVELYCQNVCLGILMQGVPFRLEMAAGTSYEYSIRISRRVSTDLNPAEDTQCDKDNKWYDVLGRPLPQDAHGVFIRKGEKIIK